MHSSRSQSICSRPSRSNASDAQPLPAARLSTSSTPLRSTLTRLLHTIAVLSQVDLVMCYYVKLYALQLAMKTPNKSKEDLALVAEQMNWLEAHQQQVKALSKEEARQRAETFALQVRCGAETRTRRRLLPLRLLTSLSRLLCCSGVLSRRR